MPDLTKAAAGSRVSRVLTTAAVVLCLSYTGLMAFISVPLLTDIADDDGIPRLLKAIAVVAGPFSFWGFIGLGKRLSALGWTAGLAATAALIVLTGASLVAASDGHGFFYWLLITTIVICNVAAFCVIPHTLVRMTRGHRR
ncbi:hypothetical protein [Streptomyces sp. NPDC059271]|uniref:hypothetical protein n=1 Tax=Streptomyces sp. NPDC059271 TaxID=3346799 RepID=UPI0036ABBF8B